MPLMCDARLQKPTWLHSCVFFFLKKNVSLTKETMHTRAVLFVVHPSLIVSLEVSVLFREKVRDTELTNLALS